jgi:hypothetical protein
MLFIFQQVTGAAECKTGHGNYPQSATALCCPSFGRLQVLLNVELGMAITHDLQLHCAICLSTGPQMLLIVELGMAVTHDVQLHCAICLSAGCRCC